ncbi:MAG TPA: hypothetical protein VN285_00475 [Candidatus Deferrimicrobium sp.]|nr:hypothetical protein [Candidatus Deferrimicrobium sp.]
MTRRFSTILLLSFVLSAFLALTVFGAQSATQARTGQSVVQKSFYYSFAGAEKPSAASSKDAPRKALGSAAPSASPGVVVNPANGGNTTYDYQHNGSVGRSIVWGKNGDTLQVHHTWMDMPGYTLVDRAYQFEVWDAKNGTWGLGSTIISYGGYTNIAVTPTNQAVVTGHVRASDPEPNRIYTYFDFGPGFSFFAEAQVAPDSVDFYCEGDSLLESGHIWPKVAYTETSTDTVLHIFAERTDGAGLLSYMRGVTSWDALHQDANVTWDSVPYCVDTVADIAYDVVAQGNKVALIWYANLPKPGDCDTCSSSGYWPYGQWDNDLFWQMSTDAGATWQPRVNVTKNQNGVEGYRPYTDASCLFDAGGNLHVVTVSQYWPADINSGGTVNLGVGRIFHYASNDVTKAVYNARTVHNFQWEQTECDGGAWQLNASKLSISECNGKLYTLFVQFNDYDAGIMNDCSSDNSPGFPNGAANGDLYLTISEDNGTTWDKARNLTNSRTPGCDTTGGAGGPCDSDHWPTMSRFGTNYVGTWPSGTYTVNPPSGTGDDGYYLFVQYINDKSAGGIVQSEGFWQQNPVKTFRVWCVDAIKAAQLIVTPFKYDFPTWTKHGVKLDTTLRIEAAGNCSLHYSLTTTGTGMGPAGPVTGDMKPGEIDAHTISMNTDLHNVPGTIVYRTGSVVIAWNGIGCPPATATTTVDVKYWIADTVVKPVWDTLETSCTRLTIANTGNWGHQGKGKVNMDYRALGGDCDTTYTYYIYDASPIICYKKGAVEHCSYQFAEMSFADTNGMKPVGNHTPVTDMGDYYVFESGKIVTADSNIAIEKVWYAPKSNNDTCSFMIQCVKVYLNQTSEAMTNIRIGEIMDWDIPSDSGSDNVSGFNASLNLIYQRGLEGGGGCQSNANRWGGIDWLDGFKNGVRYTTNEPHGAYTSINSKDIYPWQTINEDSAYKYMANSGYTAEDSITDQYTLMTFDTIPSLAVADTYVFYVEIVSHKNGDLASFENEVRASKKWYCDHISPIPCGCCVNRGNVDDIIGPAGPVDVSDLTYLVAFLFSGGAAPPCVDQANVDGIVGPAGPVDVSDLTYLVAFLFSGGAAPPPC